MRLLVFHYHDRPGGVREVISRGLPLLVERLLAAGEEVSSVDFLAGELADQEWRAGLSEKLNRTAAAAGLKNMPLRWTADVEWGYAPPDFRDLSAASHARLREILTPRFSAAGKPERTVLWAHNLSVGRNIPLLRALPELCQEAGVELWLHHHDWWWDGRWARRRDWQAAGVDSLDEALSASIPSGPRIRHFCVNRADLPFLEAAAGSAAARWVGNPLPPLIPPTTAEIQTARRWLMDRTGGRPAWLAPVRALRRKNLAEALQVTRCLEPGGCLVTTAGCSSAGEAAGWQKLKSSAARHGWPLVPEILAGDMDTPPGTPAADPGGRTAWLPSVSALIAASDVVILTSLQEGFGLPWLEAAALGKPVISRRLPDAVDNLGALGCGLSGMWKALPVPDSFYDRNAEADRVDRRLQAVGSLLPEAVRRMVFKSPSAQSGGMEAAFSDADAEGGTLTDFGALTLEAQLEVLSGDPRRFPIPSGLRPQVQSWSEECREDSWTDRLFGERLGGPGENYMPTRVGSVDPLAVLKAEVGRRLTHWLRHPLLWPD